MLVMCCFSEVLRVWLKSIKDIVEFSDFLAGFTQSEGLHKCFEEPSI